MSWIAGAAVAITAAIGQANEWASVWADLDALRGGSLSAVDSEACRARLHQALGAAPQGPSAVLLQACLEALDGRDSSSAAMHLERSGPEPFTGAELWHLADLLPRGPERAGTVRRALELSQPLSRWQALLAWNVAIDEARALRLEQGALPIQLALHDRYQDAATAHDLALTHRALGNGQVADRVLAEAIQAEMKANGDSTDLWEARGINALGFGDERLARDYLGKALARGSRGAALLLSRMELLSNRLEPARLGFRASLLDTPPPDWGWRGWGATLLPPGCASPASRPLPPSHE